jgi:hypothetical protein
MREVGVGGSQEVISKTDVLVNKKNLEVLSWYQSLC